MVLAAAVILSAWFGVVPNATAAVEVETLAPGKVVWRVALPGEVAQGGPLTVRAAQEIPALVPMSRTPTRRTARAPIAARDSHGD